MKTRSVHSVAAKRLAQGMSLLTERDFPHPPSEEGVVGLTDSAGKWIGTAYFSKENKGIGWFLGPGELELDQGFFERLFGAAKQARQSFAAAEETTAYRLFHQDGDGFGGMTVDLYGEMAVFSWYNAFVYSLKEVIVSAFQVIFPEVVGAYEKIRFKGLDYESAHLFGQKQEDPFVIWENGVAYQVFLNDGLMTGIFLDQHEVRKNLVSGLAKGHSVLNLFSYTAAFSVAASRGGARQTTSVDLAKRSRELSEAHFLANNMPLEQHKLVVMDVFDYFRYAKRHELVYDMIIIDPPSFARNKKRTFSVVKDFHRLVAEAVDILSDKGVLILSTNAANVSLEKFRTEVEKGLKGYSHRYLATHRLPDDFRYNKTDESSNYLKVFTIQVEK